MIKFKYVYGEEGYEQSKEFRKIIFCDEMNYKEEKDAHDDSAIHFIGREEDVIMSYGRMYKIADYTFCIDKVCVNKADRRQYVGDTVMRALEDKAVAEIGTTIVTKATKESFEFFGHEGYFDIGEEFEEDGIVYKKMKKDLTKVRGCKGGCHK